MRRWWLAALVPVLLAAFSACGGDAPSQPSGAPGKTLTVTAVPPSPVIAEILRQVANLRGLPAPTTLKVAAVARGDVPALLDQALTESDRQWFGRTTTLYRLLGFLRPDEDYLSIYRAFAGTAVIGLYEPATKTLYVVTGDGSGIEDLSAEEKETVAHELTHALQDAAFDLGQLSSRVQDNLDQNLAFTALVEGDAVTNEQLWARRSSAAGGGALLFGRPAPFVSGVSAAIERELRFPYTAGVEWVSGVRAAGGTAAVDALLRDPPAGTSVVLHPELAAKGRRPEAVVLPPLEQGLGPGWRRESEGTLGEFVLRNFLQQSIRALDAVNAAAGWSGDHYAVYSSSTESLAVARLRFGSTAERDRFASSLGDWLSANGGKDSGEATTLGDGRQVAQVAAGSADLIVVFGSKHAPAGRALALLAGG